MDLIAGCLVFFKEGLFFGIKKPLMFFEIEKILDITIFGVTGRCFNILVKYQENGEKTEHEFSYLDASTYDG